MSSAISFDAIVAGKGIITVINQLGQQVYNWQVNVSSGSNAKYLDVSKLPAGVYMLRLQTGGNIRLRKVIIGK